MPEMHIKTQSELRDRIRSRRLQRRSVGARDGRDGRDGLDGLDGLPGSPGPAGAVGLDGRPGPIGPVGPAGADGKDGKDGADGRAAPVIVMTRVEYSPDGLRALAYHDTFIDGSTRTRLVQYGESGRVLGMILEKL